MAAIMPFPGSDTPLIIWGIIGSAVFIGLLWCLVLNALVRIFRIAYLVLSFIPVLTYCSIFQLAYEFFQSYKAGSIGYSRAQRYTIRTATSTKVQTLQTPPLGAQQATNIEGGDMAVPESLVFSDVGENPDYEEVGQGRSIEDSLHDGMEIDTEHADAVNTSTVSEKDASVVRYIDAFNEMLKREEERDDGTDVEDTELQVHGGSNSVSTDCYKEEEGSTTLCPEEVGEGDIFGTTLCDTQDDGNSEVEELPHSSSAFAVDFIHSVAKEQEDVSQENVYSAVRKHVKFEDSAKEGAEIVLHAEVHYSNEEMNSVSDEERMVK